MQNIAKHILRAALLAGLAGLTSCGPIALIGLAAGGGGGGGGGGGNANPARLSVADIEIGSGQENVDLDLVLDRQGTNGVLMQFDLELPDGVSLLGADGGESGRRLERAVDPDDKTLHRIVYGTPGDTEPLRAGLVVRLRLFLRDTSPAFHEIRVTNPVIAAADGSAVAIDPAAQAFAGRITVL